jgi:NADH dehydrogenase
MSDLDTTHVVIVGGGIAGVACAKRLAPVGDVQVTLLDKTGFYEFPPLYYQLATAELTPNDARFELQRVFAKHRSVDVRTAEVASVDPGTRTVTLTDGESITGDALVLAAGSQPNFFHTPGADKYAYPLYSVDGAERIRHRLLELFRDAAAKPELIDDGALTLVVVGAGPTGVEIAGALSDLVREVMPHLYADLAVSRAKILLVDPGHVPLAPFSDDAHTYVAQQLHKRGVELRLGLAVKSVGPDSVELSDGTTIATHLVIWGGGEMAAALATETGISQGRGGRIDVRPDLTVNGFNRVYAIGDFANIPFGDEAALPQLGSVALQSGRWAADNIVSELDYAGRRSFHYHDKGIMAMIGRKAAIAEVGQHRHELHGRVAFAAWLGVHAELLADAGAELNAFFAWAEEFYLRPHHRSARLLDPATADQPRIKWASGG